MANNSIQTLRGFRDFLPEEAQKREWLKNRLTEIFKLWGFEPMETPTLEALELFEGQIGEDEKLFFKFSDPGGREVALRYDQTVPTCRVVGQYKDRLTMPFKRYQIQPAFRAERPQKGRYREFLQCDADIFGSSSPLADAEVIGLSLDIYRQLGFPNAKVRINDRSLLKDIPYQAIVSIDKLEKIGREGVIEDMITKNITPSDAQKYLEIVEKIQPNETVTVILEYLKNLGFAPDWYTFDPTIARSFSYSTGPIWEVVIPGIKGSVLGGERFDQLVEKVSGINIPGTGFGLGFDRTLEAMEELGLIPETSQSTKVLVTVFSPETLNTSTKIVGQLRQKGIASELYPDVMSKIGKQVKYADKRKIPFVIVVGPDEIAQDTLTLKQLATGKQQVVKMAEAISLITQSR